MINKVDISPVNMKERADLGIKAGDTVRVWIKIEEKGKTRLQAFEGLVLARKHGNEAGGTFTVRKVSSGVGVEKIFPLYSPVIDKIEIVKRAKVRRAKLYFIRDKVAREVKRLLRRTTMMGISTKGASELEAERKKAEEEENARKEAEDKLAEEKSAQEAPVEAETEKSDTESVEDKNEEEEKEEIVEDKAEEEKSESKENKQEETIEASESEERNEDKGKE